MMEEIAEQLAREGLRVYPKSVRDLPDGTLFTAERGGEKYVGVTGSVSLSSPVATVAGAGVYPLTWENYEVLKKLLPIASSPVTHRASFGTGDRLGLVTAAHLAALSGYPVFPVVAQQSPRELQKTNRTFKSVLLDAVMGVLESGYQGPFGADADHIKDEKYLREGAEAGYSMYTLDVSDWLGTAEGRSASELSPLSRKIVGELAGTTVGGYTFSEDALTESALIYEKSMEQITAFNSIIKAYMSDFDLEVSIDEGSRDTTPEDHAFSARFLRERGVVFKSLAPKFPGEFQKGVDYMGDVDALTRSMRVHGAIARQDGGYRLSLHSGSDKFSVYPLFNEATDGNFHVKTSGTSWLQAAKMIAAMDRELFVDLYNLCRENLDESKKAYHVYITKDHFPATLPNGDVVALFDNRDFRQLLHISYGVLLDNRKPQILEVLKRYETAHYQFVGEHIARHLGLLFH